MRFLYVRIQVVQGTLDMNQFVLRHMEMPLCILDIKMAQEILDIFDGSPFSNRSEIC